MTNKNVDEHFEQLMKEFDFRVDFTLRKLAADVAVQLKTIREKQGIQQAELAKRLGTGQSRISQMEDPNYGKLTLSSLVRTAEALDCDLIVRLVSRLNAAIFTDVELSESAYNKPREKLSSGSSKQKPGHDVNNYCRPEKPAAA